MGTLLQPEKKQPPYGVVPPEWPGSTAEWAVYWALTRLIGVENFVYQYPLGGGRLQRGGQVVDFYVPDRMLVIRVQGEHWHYELGSQIEVTDELLQVAIESQGFVCVDIDESDALRDPIYFVQEALRGRDHSRNTLR